MPIRIIEESSTAPKTAKVGKIRVIEPGPPVAPERKKSFGLGFMEGLGRTIENADYANPVNLIPDLPGSNASEVHAQAKAGMRDYFAEREKTEIPSPAGKFLGNTLGSVPVAMATANPWLVGGLSGALSSESKDGVGVVLDAAAGAAGGKLGDVALRGAGSLLKPVIDPAVARLSAMGVKMSPGQVFGGRKMLREDKMMSKPGVGPMISEDRQASILSANRAGVDRALAPIGIRLPDDISTGHDAIQFAETQVGKAYEAVAPLLKAAPDARFAVKFRDAAKAVRLLPKQAQDEFERLISETIQPGQLSGKALQGARSDLRSVVADLTKSDNSVERRLGRVLGQVEESFSDLIVRQNPVHAPKLKAADQAYKGVRIVSGAAARTDEGIWNTGQLKSSVIKHDYSKDKRMSAQGRAFMQDLSKDFRKVLPAKTPDSGTAGRLLEGNLASNLLGALRAIGYQGDRLGAKLALAPRPAWAGPAADALLKLKRPAGLIGGTAASQRKP